MKSAENGSSIYLHRETMVSVIDLADGEEKLETLQRAVTSSRSSVALCAAYLVSNEGLVLSADGEVSPWAGAILSSEGIIPKPTRRDRIADILRQHYKTPGKLGFDFRHALGQRSYRRALRHLMEAELSFRTQRSRYVLHMDNFNQILVKALFRRYGKARMPWENVWGSIDHKGLNGDFPTFTTVAKLCHNLRTSSPEPHPYSQTLGAFGREVKVGQRNRLVGQLKAGYRDYVEHW